MARLAIDRKRLLRCESVARRVRILAACDVPDATQTTIIHDVGVPATTVTRRLREFERRGYVHRRSAADDGRRFYLSLTMAGRVLLADRLRKLTMLVEAET